MTKKSIPDGFCQCGCNQRTKRVTSAVKSRGLKAGDYRKYVRGHQGRTSPKTTIEDQAKEKGYGSEFALLADYIEKFKTQEKVGLELGCSPSWVGRRCRELGVTKKSNVRLTNEEKREKYNAENGTDYKTTREWLARLREQVGASRTVAITGTKVSYINQCFYEQQKFDGKKDEFPELSDTRPSNLQGPWTNPKKNPCLECDFGLTRDKNEPGCVACPLPGQYVQLIEQNYYPGVKTPHQAAVYYNARGHQHNWHEWGQR